MANKNYLGKNVASSQTNTSYINKDATKLIENIENGDDSKAIISFLHLQTTYQCFSDWSKVEMNEFWNFYQKFHE